MRASLWVSAGGLLACLAFSGCAPNRFEQALPFYADQHRVRDAAARRVSGYWHLRFNELMISDLDDAIRETDERRMRDRAADVLRAANGLGRTSAFAEIDRLPHTGKVALAKRAGSEATADALKAHYDHLARAALHPLLADVELLPAGQLRDKLRQIRRAIEPAPDDQGRLARQVALVWGAAPAWVGVGAVERRLDEERPTKLQKVFDRAVTWRPRSGDAGDPLAQFAPTIVIEWPAERSYPEALDRFGEVYLTGTPADVRVNINTSRPTVYGYTSQAKIHGRRYTQLVYTWWYPRRPEMTDSDPAAGHIDGDVLRVTLDSKGRPAIFEVVQGCGCGHLVFVAQHVEDVARCAFGKPQPGKSLVVEKDVKGKRDLIIAGTVAVPDGEAHPVVYVLAGYHEVSRIDCACRGQQLDGESPEEHAYELASYDMLERLALGDGVASMFGPDGLVHGAGRPEGLLLAPTGILSAGQPRKRGTQKIRWDEYSFDDPHLLERALRLPDDL